MSETEEITMWQCQYCGDWHKALCQMVEVHIAMMIEPQCRRLLKEMRQNAREMSEREYHDYHRKQGKFKDPLERKQSTDSMLIWHVVKLALDEEKRRKRK